MSSERRRDAGIEDFTTLLKEVGLDLCAEDVMDILWLANQTEDIPAFTSERSEDSKTEAIDEGGEDLPLTTLSPADRVAVTQRDSPSQERRETRHASPGGVSITVPAAPALRTRLELGRALRPLMRKVAALNQTYLDEEATANQIAEQDVWFPVMRPAAERWLELALVVEESKLTPVWRSVIEELKLLTERQGAFRTVRLWRLKSSDDGHLQLFPGNHSPSPGQKSRSPKELIDPAGRRLILLVSDCTSSLWQQSQIYRWLALWSKFAPMTVVQLFPQRLWERSAVGRGTPVWVSSMMPAMATCNWQVEETLDFLSQLEQDAQKPNKLTIPVVTVEPNSIKSWAKVMVGAGEAKAAGVQFDWAELQVPTPSSVPEAEAVEPIALVRRFRGSASIQAQHLAGLMAAVPVSPEIVDLIRQTLLPEARQVHVAEVFMSGLIRTTRTESASGGHNLKYDFVSEDVRDLLTDAVDVLATEKVLDTVSRYISARLGLGTRTFEALLTPDLSLDENEQAQVLPFAYLARRTLQRMGSEYAALVELLGQPITKPSSTETALPSAFPPLETFDFIDAQLVDETEIEAEPVFPSPLRFDDFTVITFQPQRDTDASQELEAFDFTVATLTRKKKKWEIQRQQQSAYRFIERLPSDLLLEMVAIPGDTFTMGSPESEPGRSYNESPQHRVSVEAFFMGRTFVTQAQWHVVTTLPQLERKLNPAPSYFKGEDRPVEQVSWDDAMEFCARLSVYTGRQYRLPTEAEWEYACRAGTTTPFHFGDMILTQVANFDCREAFNRGPKGEYRGETTPVNYFDGANAFGLSDMHGNIWEWCQDHWHSNYEGAPNDGSAWVERGEASSHVIRGGSWIVNPRSCRSAYRPYLNRGSRPYNIGFRVVCSAPRT